MKKTIPKVSEKLLERAYNHCVSSKVAPIPIGYHNPPHLWKQACKQNGNVAIRARALVEYVLERL